jgi:ABC-type nitrate/sulfonate/bicarbonate transport system ATPase subunit
MRGELKRLQKRLGATTVYVTHDQAEATTMADLVAVLRIGAFQDGGLRPFKERIVPRFERETGIEVEFLEDEYGTFFEKAFNDGRSKAGRYDV